MTRGLNPKGDALRTARARPSVASTGGTVSVRPVFPAGIGALVTVRPGFPHRELWTAAQTAVPGLLTGPRPRACPRRHAAHVVCRLPLPALRCVC